MIGLKVRVKDKVGTVSNTYKTPCGSKVCIIDLENGEKIKAFEDDVEIVKDEPEKPVGEKEITINMNDFAEAVAKSTIKACKGDYTMGLLYVNFGSLVGQLLFKEEKND
jgi:hypothetical protein